MQLNAPEPSDSETLSPQSIFIRNYDATEVHSLNLRLSNTSDEVVAERVVTVGSQDTLNLRPNLNPGTYEVQVIMDSEASDSVDCLIGDNLNECAVIECGNGVVSVSAGHRTRPD